MELNTVIFDMDGLLIDSEPLWNEAATEVFAQYGKKLTTQEFEQTTGLRTSEFVSWWLRDYKFDNTELEKVGGKIIRGVIERVETRGQPLPGIQHIINFFHERKFKIGLATSSPLSLVEVVCKRLGIGEYIHVKTSAEHLEYGKPHPQVYLNCAAELQSSPLQCICFEDSVNGMISAKAARMKVVVVPEEARLNDPKFGLADVKLRSLEEFDEEIWNSLL